MLCVLSPVLRSAHARAMQKVLSRWRLPLGSNSRILAPRAIRTAEQCCACPTRLMHARDTARRRNDSCCPRLIVERCAKLVRGVQQACKAIVRHTGLCSTRWTTDQKQSADDGSYCNKLGRRPWCERYNRRVCECG